MKFTVTIEMERVLGPEQDKDTVIDAFCGTIGKDNGAPRPLNVIINDGWGNEPASTYIVKLADDR